MSGRRGWNVELIEHAEKPEVSHVVRPRRLVLVLVGLGVFQRLSATVEEKVGDDDDAEERKDKVKRKSA